MNWFYYNCAWFFQNLVWPGTRSLLWAFGDLKVIGLENLRDLPPEKGVIFAANHTSELDAAMIPGSLPFLSGFLPVFYTSRERSFYKNAGIRQAIYGGMLFKLMGAHPVTAGLKDYEKSLTTHIEILKKGKSVLIFPEGGIPKTVDGKVEEKPAKGGLVYLAEKTGVPIVPVTLSGAYKITPAEFIGRKRKITVEFGAPIYDVAAGNGDHSTRAQVILNTIKSKIKVS